MTIRLIRLPVAALLLWFVLGAGFPLSGQNRRNDNSRFYNGAHQGVRGGDYGNDRGRNYNNSNYSNYDRGRHDDNRYRNNQGGIGPGKGALIGGAGGAALGAIFGGGVKGTLITGAAGAGIGAIIGNAAQNNRDRNNGYRR